jgi:hypothetical protein
MSILIFKRGADKIALIGVENWGHNFKKKLETSKLLAVDREDFKT